MAIQALKTYQELESRVLAEKSYRSIKEVERDLDKIADMVTDSLSLLSLLRKNMVRAGSFNFVIKDEDADKPPANSPNAKKDGKVRHLKELNQNFAVVQQLFDAKGALETLEAKLRTANRDMGSDVNKGLADIEKIRKTIFKGLDTAFAFLNKEAAETIPPAFAAFVDRVALLVSNMITYKDAGLYTYMFAKDNDVYYCSYLQLKEVIDENGDKLPELFIVTSALINDTTSEYYIDLLFEFEPPSPKLMTSKVNPAKIATVGNELADLLSFSHFANSIKRVPIDLWLDTKHIKRDIFTSSELINSVEFNEDHCQLSFWLKPTVTDKTVLDKLTTQLYLDVKGLMTATKARLRIIPAKQHEDPAGRSCYVIGFMLIKVSDGPAASIDDVAFLKERFGLSDTAVTTILKAINKG